MPQYWVVKQSCRTTITKGSHEPYVFKWLDLFHHCILDEECHHAKHERIAQKSYIGVCVWGVDVPGDSLSLNFWSSSRSLAS